MRFQGHISLHLLSTISVYFLLSNSNRWYSQYLWPCGLIVSSGALWGLGVERVNLDASGMICNSWPFSNSSGYLSPPTVVKDSIWPQDLGQVLVERRGKWRIVEGQDFLSISFPLKLIFCYCAPYLPLAEGWNEQWGIGLKYKRCWAAFPDPNNNKKE